MTSTKQRIIKSHRLRTRNGIVAFSDAVYADIQHCLVRINGHFVMKKGTGDEVMDHLYRSVQELPDHFTEKSRAALNYIPPREEAA